MCGVALQMFAVFVFGAGVESFYNIVVFFRRVLSSEHKCAIVMLLSSFHALYETIFQMEIVPNSMCS